MRITLPIGATTLAGAFAVTLATMTLAMGTSASAASAIQKECSTKYQAAKTANTLNGMTYNQYYKQCAAEAKTDKAAPGTTPAATAPAAPTTAPKPTPATTAPVAPKAAPAPTTTAAAPLAPKAPMAPAAAGSAVFPTAVSAEFSKETAGKARMHTCLAQYKANKTSNGNGGLKWIEKGGGYYSECNTRLKG